MTTRAREVLRELEAELRAHAAYDAQVASMDGLASGTCAVAAQCAIRDTEAASALSALIAECEWLPIESAPKDGTEILLWCEPDYAIAKWMNRDWQAMADGYRAIEYQGDFGTEYRTVWGRFWRPLPPPPPPVPVGEEKGETK